MNQVREAGRILREEQMARSRLSGFRRRRRYRQGKVDVVVTEGFAGNIALKTAEGTARQIGEYLSGAMTRSLGARIGYLFARSAFRQLRDRLDPRRPMAASFSASTASSSKATAAPTPRASPPPSSSATAWCAMSFLPRSRPRSARHGRSRTQRSAEPPRDRSPLRCRSAAAATCRTRSSPTPTSRARSTPPTNGSCSAPASTSAASPRPAN